MIDPINAVVSADEESGPSFDKAYSVSVLVTNFSITNSRIECG